MKFVGEKVKWKSDDLTKGLGAGAAGGKIFQDLARSLNDLKYFETCVNPNFAGVGGTCLSIGAYVAWRIFSGEPTQAGYPQISVENAVIYLPHIS